MIIQFSVSNPAFLIYFLDEKTLIGSLKANEMSKAADFQYKLGAFSKKEKPIVMKLERIPEGQKIAYPSLSTQLTEIPTLMSMFEHHI